MKHKLITPLAAVSAVLALSAATTSTAARPSAALAAAGSQARYVYTDLGVLGGLDSRAFGLNDLGQVVGHADTSPNSGNHGFRAFLWTPVVPNGTTGSMTDLGALPGDQSSVANATNDSSLVVGESLAPDLSASRAFVWNGTMHDLGGFGGSYTAASGINAAGAITGYSKASSGADHAFVWIPDQPGSVKGKMHDLGTLPGHVASEGKAINDAGVIVGDSLDSGYLSHAFIWRPDTPNGAHGTMAALPVPTDAQFSGASAINNSGMVTGSIVTATGAIHAFLFDGNTSRDLGTLPGGTASDAYGINSAGVAVGYSETAVRANDHAVLFADGNVTDLNRYLPGPAKAAGVVLVVAYDINDHGQIAGYAIIGGHAHGFLLTPAS